MKIIKSELEEKFSKRELQKIASRLDKMYKVSFFWDGWKALNQEVVQYLDIDLNLLKERCSYREIFNFIIMNYGKTEKRIKYYLTKEYMENEDEVCLYEFKVGNSRLDFGRINGNSYAYEIKTELDTISRLENQIIDYQTVFDYISVVIHPKHEKKVKEVLPRAVGIICYHDHGDTIEFETRRIAKRNRKIRKKYQLDLLNSKDLSYIIKKYISGNIIPNFKDEKQKIVKRVVKSEDFNSAFKETIKWRHNKKWEHIKKNFNMLMPIEIQKVYTNEIDIKYICY